ncbi:MAG: FAD synthase [Methanonatronarchaeales archaeon]|nr:FAD synthase [Methanonatronarchaeales archaeon]
MRVLATGTFDLLHPGHLAYLEQAGQLGDELYVIVARDKRSEKRIVVPEEQRRRMVGGLRPVDRAVLGSEDDMFRPVVGIDPDVLALGPDQEWDEYEIRRRLGERGLDTEVVRVERYEECGLCSSSEIVERVLELFG